MATKTAMELAESLVERGQITEGEYLAMATGLKAAYARNTDTCVKLDVCDLGLVPRECSISPCSELHLSAYLCPLTAVPSFDGDAHWPQLVDVIDDDGNDTDERELGFTNAGDMNWFWHLEGSWDMLREGIDLLAEYGRPDCILAMTAPSPLLQTVEAAARLGALLQGRFPSLDELTLDMDNTSEAAAAALVAPLERLRVLRIKDLVVDSGVYTDYHGKGTTPLGVVCARAHQLEVLDLVGRLDAITNLLQTAHFSELKDVGMEVVGLDTPALSCAWHAMLLQLLKQAAPKLQTVRLTWAHDDDDDTDDDMCDGRARLPPM